MKKKGIAIFAIALAVVIAVVYFLSTKKTSQKAQKIDPRFTTYISGFTSGTISSQDYIRIILMDGVPDVEENTEAPKDILNFKPTIKGKALWINNRTIEFRPEKRLLSGQVFNAEFNLGKVKQVPAKLQKFKFDFQIIRQSFTSNVKGIKPYNKKDLKLQSLIGTVNTADYSSTEEINGILEAKQGNKALSIQWISSSDGKKHSFQIDSINRTEQQETVVLKWNGSSIGVEGKSEDNVDIPALGDFKIMNIAVTQQPSQFITLSFSDPLDERQNLDGLIRLENGTDLRFIIEDNDVKIYPEVRQLSSSRLIVDPGVKNILGYKLKDAFTSSIKFQSIKPKVELIGKGNILPSSNGLIFPFKAVNISAVNVRIIKIYENNVLQFFQENQYNGYDRIKRVGRIVFNDEVPLTAERVVDYGQWNTFSLDLSKLIQAETGAIYRVQINFDKSQSLYPCQGETEETEEFEDKKEEVDLSDVDYWGWDGYDGYDYSHNYSWRDREYPCSKSYYMRNNQLVSRNILASDIGIIAKGGNSKEMIFAVTDLISTKPLSGVSIDIYNFQQQKIGSTTTGNNGIAKIELEKKPYILVAKKGTQFGYLRLDNGSALSLSMFNVGGNQSNKGIKGYIYGERGVWRPGDSLYVSFILEDKNEVLPKDHPVVFDLIDPRGQIYSRQVKSKSVGGIYDFRTKTSTDAPTGNWLAKIKVGGSIFEKTLKIETIKPNRLKIELDFGQDILTKDFSGSGNLTVKWLHGAIASNLKADVEMKLSNVKTTFKDYPEFVFDDPAKEYYGDEKMVFDGQLDANGNASFTPKFYAQSNAPGMLQASFKMRAFENSGEFSVGSKSIPYSPYSSYIGVKVPEGKGWNGALMSDKKHTIPVVTVDENGKPISRNNLKVQVYKLRWRWWWERNSDDNVARYIRNTSSTLELSTSASTENGEGTFELKLKQNYWGRMLIKITDPFSGHSTGKIIYMDYSGWWSRKDKDAPGGATMLTFALNKKSYQVGEEAVVTFPSSGGGRALVSIESGSKVVYTDWVETVDGTTSYKFAVTKQMAPNVYIHVSLIQPHNQTINDLPIRLYGVQPMLVENPETHIKPIISMPDVLEPNGDVTIQVTEESGREMYYTVAVVDDGLLDLTNFITPEAWNHFYARDALGVKTWDMYDYVMGAFSGEMAGLLEIGGDEFAEDGGAKQANRFKPVVKFLGPFKLKSGEKANHSFTMPNYVGSVRTMVVGSNKGAYGSTEKTTPVKKPLMVLATLPRVVGPDEQVKLPVTIFAMDPSIKNVKVSVESNELLIANGVKTQQILFEREGDQVIYFDYKIASELGIGKVKVIAESGKEKAEYEIEIDIRPSNPRISKVISTAIDPGQTWSESYEAIGIKGTNNGILEVSRIVPINLENRLQFLIRYPHGCIEQTTSSVFPQLYLDNFMDLTQTQKDEIEKNIRAGIDRLRTFQQSDGGMSYWPGSYEGSNEWGSNYAGHFMLEAKLKGYDLPFGWFDAWVKYQKKIARKWSPDRSGSRLHYYNRNDLIQAYRLYTLALAEEPALPAMNRMREMKGLSTQAKWRLAAAYYLAGKPEVAIEIIKDVETTIKEYKEFGYTYGSSQRDQAMIIEALALMKDRSRAKSMIEDLAKDLGSNRWYSTQTTAYSLIAISKYLGTDSGDKTLKFAYKLNNDKEKNAVTEMPIAQFSLDMKTNPNGTISVTNNGSVVVFARIIIDGIPATSEEISSESDLRMTVRYLNKDGNEINVSKLVQGTDIIAEVSVHHPGIRTDYQEMALNQIFPSGWEIRNTRMEEFNVNYAGDKPDYQDIRDDRVYTYFDLKKNERKTFRVQLNAAYLGKFYHPTVYCEAMYDNEVNAKKAGKWIEIIEPGK
ncbi:alpha-2-macroglobulin [Bacteroidota bacterium]